MLSQLSIVLGLAATALALPAPQEAKPHELVARDPNFRNFAYWSYLTANGAPYPILPQTTENPSHITHLSIFSIDLHSSGTELTVAGFAANDTKDLGNLWGEVADMQAAGIKVMATLGAYQASCWLLLQSNFSKYYPVLLNFIKEYKLDGLDLDIEPNANNQTPNIGTPEKLIRQLRSDLGSSFIISMAPVAADLTANPPLYSGFNYKTLDNNLVMNGVHLIDFFNGQFYNGWGDCGDTTTYNQIITNGYAAERVVFGVLSNQQDGNDWCSITQLQATIKQLLAEYPTMGGVDEYEIQRAGSNDNLTPWQWHQAIYNASVASTTSTSSLPVTL